MPRRLVRGGLWWSSWHGVVVAVAVVVAGPVAGRTVGAGVVVVASAHAACTGRSAGPAADLSTHPAVNTIVVVVAA